MKINDASNWKRTTACFTFHNNASHEIHPPSDKILDEKHKVWHSLHWIWHRTIGYQYRTICNTYCKIWYDTIWDDFDKYQQLTSLCKNYCMILYDIFKLILIANLIVLNFNYKFIIVLITLLIYYLVSLIVCQLFQLIVWLVIAQFS